MYELLNVNKVILFLSLANKNNFGNSNCPETGKGSLTEC